MEKSERDIEGGSSKRHIAILASPGMGHLIPLTQLGERLIENFNMSVSLILPQDNSPMTIQKQFLQNFPTINSILLPPVNLPHSTHIETRIALAFTLSLPSLRHTLKALLHSTRLSVLVADVFGTLAFELARDLGISPYVFRSSNAMSLAALLRMPDIDQTLSPDLRDFPEPLHLFSGCKPVYGSDFPDPVQVRNTDAYAWMLKVSQMHQLAEGILVNSFFDLEPAAFKALNEGGLCKPPVYPVGPVIRSGDGGGLSNDELTQKCLAWLDEQPSESVLFVSFGSGGTLSCIQVAELAAGLEMSGQRFIWVVKSPNEEAANACYFSAQTKKDPFDFLPEGFLERTNGMGLVLSSWAPQIEILGHGSTGGFMSHCGWNSTLESIVRGVPLIAWPLFAEQRMNAIMLAEDLNVALRVKVHKHSLVERDEVAMKVKELLTGDEGAQLRTNVRFFKAAATNILGEEGCSTDSLHQVVKIWIHSSI